MKKALLVLAVLFASASASQACGRCGKRVVVRQPQQPVQFSACVTAPPLQFQFTASNPNTGRVVVNPVRSAVGRVVGMPSTCLSGQCR